MKLYLHVPYSEKDEAKSLGAKWNAKVKKWYIDTRISEYTKFSKWILRNADCGTIVKDNIFIIEGKQKCWKCGGTTTVIGLGVSEFMQIYLDVDSPKYELIGGYPRELHLAWTSDEDDIPPMLLMYLKQNYCVKTGYSKTMNEKCFANHCECCGVLQGNHFLFSEPDSCLCSIAHNDEDIKRIGNLRIKCIPIEDNLQLNWDIEFSSDDYIYFEYGKLEELVLSTNIKNKRISYEELYCL